MKVLIANRGEIAVRIIRACRELGLETVAVYSDCDSAALHVRLADQVVAIGAAPAIDSYLRVDALVDAARQTGAHLVHPGYGFLAENATFARACVEAGLTFVGPSPEVIARMGSKTEAREVAVAAGVPVVPGGTMFAADAADDEIVAAAATVGYPLLIKAVAGGGGKGMRTVERPDDVVAAARRAVSEAQSAFGDGRCYVERRLSRPRHIEIQLLGGSDGRVVPFVERECSIQRRHQKVVEESPSPAMSSGLRQAMADAAVRIAEAVGYTNAGTIEFLVDADGAFYFLEMNTRLQVEHPVTEAVTGIDLVQWQLRIALGERLGVDPLQALTPLGHAIECRVYAEDPDQGFLPSPGRVTVFDLPGGPGVRHDSGITAGDEVPIHYDPLIAKLTVHAGSREAAIARLGRVLDEYRVAGVQTTLPFFSWLVRQPAFAAGSFDTTYLDRVLAERREPFDVPSHRSVEDAVMVAAIVGWLDVASDSSPRGAPRTRWRDAARSEAVR
jgi:acetyl-CoA carboxylase biotin carboxylase subunit